jgi:hypothetical protein
MADVGVNDCAAEVKVGFWAREARASATGFPSGAWEPVARESVAREAVRLSVTDRYVLLAPKLRLGNGVDRSWLKPRFPWY